MRKYFLPGVILSLLLLVIFPISSSNAFDDLDVATTIPIIESVDLNIDGDPAVTVSLTKDFDYILRLIFELSYDDPVYVSVEFAEAGPLVNGICICVDSEPLLDFNITRNDDFAQIAYDTDIVHDEANPKDTHIHTRFSFWKFSPNGLRYSSVTSLQFIVQDDMTAAALDILAFTIQVEGFKIEEQVSPKQYPLNPFDYFNRWALWALTQPLVWLMIIIGFIIIIFVFRNLMR